MGILTSSFSKSFGGFTKDHTLEIPWDNGDYEEPLVAPRRIAKAFLRV